MGSEQLCRSAPGSAAVAPVTQTWGRELPTITYAAATHTQDPAGTIPHATVTHSQEHQLQTVLQSCTLDDILPGGTLSG